MKVVFEGDLNKIKKEMNEFLGLSQKPGVAQGAPAKVATQKKPRKVLEEVVNENIDELLKIPKNGLRIIQNKNDIPKKQSFAVLNNGMFLITNYANKDLIKKIQHIKEMLGLWDLEVPKLKEKK
jgi:hypothetical protein